jgi:hypothetical protein
MLRAVLSTAKVLLQVSCSGNVSRLIKQIFHLLQMPLIRQISPVIAHSGLSAY